MNFAAIVADYNVADSHEMGGKGPTLDTDYLVSLGPQAIPAIDRFLAIRQPASLVERRDTLAHWRRAALNSWRAWTFRGWRLKRIWIRPMLLKPTPIFPSPPRAFHDA